MKSLPGTLAIAPPRRVRVLVADDAWELRRLVCDAFERHHDLLVVGEATHGQEAFDMAEALRPDVVLLDYLLPGADSDSLVHGVHARAPAAAIVGFSGYDPEILGPEARGAAHLSHRQDVRAGRARRGGAGGCSGLAAGRAAPAGGRTARAPSAAQPTGARGGRLTPGGGEDRVGRAGCLPRGLGVRVRSAA